MKKLSTEELRAVAETLRRVQDKLARTRNLPLESAIRASAHGFRRSIPKYVWSWLGELLAPHKSLSAWMDANMPDWRSSKTPAAVVYARAEHQWFEWLIAEIEAEISDPAARAQRRSRA